jgi:diketogulonate reductase-like aldo/keto reductase
MQWRDFGPSKTRVSVVGQGTWHMESDDRSEAIRALRAGLDLGMTHIDTAELYGSGEVEEIVGEAIAGRRDEAFLVSKVLPYHANHAGTLRACEKSLARLHTDHLDVYLLHWPGNVPLEETFGALAKLRAEGKILAMGVSNFDEVELARALDIAGPGNIVENQLLYHLGERRIEHRVVPFCEAHGIAVVGYTPFGVGGFPPSGSAGRVLSDVARRHGVTPHQVALAFLTRKPSLFAIPKASRAEHTRDNAAAADLELDPRDIAELDAAFPAGPRRKGVATL